MKTHESTHCPKCNKDIGVWAIFKCPFPNVFFKCPHCNTKLKYNPVGWGYTVILLVLYTGLCFLALNYLKEDVSIVLITVILIAAWIPTELCLIKKLRKSSKLELK